MKGPSTRHQLFINGAFVPAQRGGTFESINPCTGRPWALFSAATRPDVESAVGAAFAAFHRGPWTQMAPSDRAALLRRLGDAIADNAAELAELETTDNGKAIRQTRSELAITPQWYWYFAGAADKIEGRHIPISHTLEAHTIRRPIGVVAAIVPYNSPILLTTWKLAPALAAGNTVVIKPSPHTPATALRLAELASEVGFPDGVINVVCGDNEVGRYLVEHPQVGKIAFTGSSETAVGIARSAAGTLKRVSCEGGGKSAHLVFPDANLDQALVAAVAGIFISTGQTCVAGSRLLVHRSIYKEFVGQVAARADALRVGDPMDPVTDLGPLASESGFEKVREYVESARADGATILAGGLAARVRGMESGYFLRPTVIVDATNDMQVCQDEIFGPVVTCLPFSDEDEAIELANDVRYGLAGGVWTNDIRRARRVVTSLDVGTVWVNNYRTVHWQAPFGGVRASGYGRENGLDALDDYTQLKTVLSDYAVVTANPFGG
jgi:acyl-CoA reductase-like NAD-dependent aldehyde dehydrogenase